MGPPRSPQLVSLHQQLYCLIGPQKLLTWAKLSSLNTDHPSLLSLVESGFFANNLSTKYIYIYLFSPYNLIQLARITLIIFRVMSLTK